MGLNSEFNHVESKNKPKKSFKTLYERVADLHVSNVPVNVHGRRDAVFGDVFVTIWTRFAVHRVNTRDGNSFMAEGYVTVNTADAISVSDLKAKTAETLLEKQKLQFFLSFSTCVGLFPLLCQCCSCCPAPFCWPAGLPRPSNCGCSSPEQFLLHGSSETH